jgi:type I restriction enzyme S subunit
MSQWPLVSLGEVLVHRKEFIEINDLENYKRCRVQLHAQGVVLRDNVPGAEIKTKKQQVCKSGEFLVAEIDAKLGGYGIVPQELEGAIVSSHYFLFGIREDRLDRSFLGYFIRTPGFFEQVAAQGSTNYAAIRPGHVLEYKIPLPPLPEQQRLVERIDALAAKIEEAKGLRKHAEQKSEYCVPGRVAQLLAETGGETARICNIADVRGGIQKSPEREPGSNPVRYLTVAHVHRDRIRVDDPRFFEVSPHELDRWRLLAGDVLIIEGNGSADQIGRTALFRGELDPCVHQNHVIRIRPDQRIVDPEFLNLYLNSPVGQEAVQTRSRTTSGLRSLSVGRIKEIEIRIPDLDTQTKVVDIAAEFKERYGRIIQIQVDTSKELNAMLPAILNRAFRGEL